MTRILSHSETEKLAALACQTKTEIEVERDGYLIRIRPVLKTQSALGAYREAKR